MQVVVAQTGLGPIRSHVTSDLTWFRLTNDRVCCKVLFVLHDVTRNGTTKLTSCPTGNDEAPAACMHGHIGVCEGSSACGRCELACPSRYQHQSLE